MLCVVKIRTFAVVIFNKLVDTGEDDIRLLRGLDPGHCCCSVGQ